MTTPKRLTRTYLALTAGLLVLFGMNLLWGSVSLTPQAVLAALLGKGQDALSMGIILQLRLPRAVMVILLGAAFGVVEAVPAAPVSSVAAADGSDIRTNADRVAYLESLGWLTAAAGENHVPDLHTLVETSHKELERVT